MNILLAHCFEDIEVIGYINKRTTAEKILENVKKCQREMKALNAKTFYREITDEKDIKECYERIYKNYSKSVVTICQKYLAHQFEIINSKEIKE